MQPPAGLIVQWKVVDPLGPVASVAVTVTVPAPAVVGVPLISPLPLLMADSTRLKQILLNLVSNAIKFTRPGGSIVVAVRQIGDGGVAFEVRDSGVGMTAAEIEIALEAFGQVDAGVGRRQEGTGLGLPLARRLAELHGGSLHIASEKGRGTTVTVSLPASRTIPAKPAALLAAEPLAGAA